MSVSPLGPPEQSKGIKIKDAALYPVRGHVIPSSKIDISNGVYLEGKRIPLYSGSMHYWRIERTLWSETLDKIKEMGFSIICTYIPWSVHEVRRGEFDFGEIKPEKDLLSFFSLCREKGIYLLVRPGPHINAEITYFGYPKRIFADYELLSRSADNTLVFLPTPPRMFPVPSYASEKFYQEVGVYFDALCPILKKHLYPEGKIIGIQADNELSLFFRTDPYDHDYSQGAIDLYYRFLKEKYGDIKKLNEVYRSNYPHFSSLLPPQEFKAKKKEELPYYLDWAEFKEYYIIYGIERIAEMLKSRGINNIPIYHNYPVPFPTTPFNLLKTEERIDIQGVDSYPHKEDYNQIKKGIEFVSTLSRLPFIPEFSSGFNLWGGLPITLEDQRFTTLAAFMHGLKGINFFMLVERERWYGSPITRDGRKRDDYYKFYQKINKLLKDIDLNNLKKKSELILLRSPLYDRLELSSSLISPLTPLALELLGAPVNLWVSEEKLGFKDAIQLEYKGFWEALFKGLTLSRYAFTLGISTMSLDKLKRYKIAFLPTFEFMEKDTQEKLLKYVEEGGILVIGPRLPLFDEAMNECLVLKEKLLSPVSSLSQARLGDLNLKSIDLFETEGLLKIEGKTAAYVKEVGKGKIVHLGFLLAEFDEFIVPKELIKLIEKIAKLADLKKTFPADSPYIDTTFHYSNSHKVLFVANPTSSPRETKIKFEGNLRFKDLTEGEEISGEGEVLMKIEPWTVKVFEVEGVVFY